MVEKVDEWNNIPSVSQDYQTARNDILKRVLQLVDQLAKKEREDKAAKKTKP